MSTTPVLLLVTLLSSVSAARAEVTFPDSEPVEEATEDESPKSGAAVTSLRLRAVSGSPLYRDTKLYQRLELQTAENFSFFGLLEKDAGEVAVADYSSFHGRWSPRPGREIVFGDLRPGFARGLVFSRAAGRSGSAMPSLRTDSRHLGHRSSSENAAFRGAAIRIGKPEGGEFLFMAGLARRDARADQSGTVRSLPQSGLHITESELAGRDQLTSVVTGLRLRRAGAKRSIGMTLQGVRYDPGIDLRRSGTVENGFVGRSQGIAAADATFGRAREGWVSVEAAIDSHLEWAFEAAGRVHLGPALIGGLMQFTSASFHTLFGSQTGSRGRNEQRTLLVAKGKSYGTTWRLHAGQLARPEPTVSNPLKTVRDVWGFEAGHAIRRRLRVAIALQGLESSNWRASTGPYGARQVRGRLESTYRFGASVRGNWTGKVRLRLEAIRLREVGDVDDGLAESISVKGVAPGLDYALLLSRFRTDSYGARVYEYEWDLPGTISVRPLFGEGWRLIALTRWRRGRLGFAMRYRRYRDRHGAAHLLGLQLEILTPKATPI